MALSTDDDDHYNYSLNRVHDGKNGLITFSERGFCLREEIQLQTLFKDGHLESAMHALCALDTAPTIGVYASLLKLCAERKSLKQARKVLTHILQQGMESNSKLGDQLVVALANCGGLLDAYDLLLKLPLNTADSWTAVIAACIECISALDALCMYKQMQDGGVQPNSYTSVVLFKACRHGGACEWMSVRRCLARRGRFEKGLVSLGATLCYHHQKKVVACMKSQSGADCLGKPAMANG
ncbi:hypothetical protein L7F22_054055 [Adiantum nelumboides]|nr:hypothetical protein [Adiantum nelumboides]